MSIIPRHRIAARLRSGINVNGCGWALGFGTLKYPCSWVEKSHIFLLNQRHEELSYDVISAAAFAFV